MQRHGTNLEFTQVGGAGQNLGDTVGGPVGPAVGKTTGNVGKTASAATTGLGKTVCPSPRLKLELEPAHGELLRSLSAS